MAIRQPLRNRPARLLPWTSLIRLCMIVFAWEIGQQPRNEDRENEVCDLSCTSDTSLGIQSRSFAGRVVDTIGNVGGG